MNKLFNLLYCIAMFFLLISCSIKIKQDIEKIFYIDNIPIRLYVSNIRINLKQFEENKKFYFVYSTLEAENLSEENGRFELKKIQLAYENTIISTNTYYDACISYLSLPIEIKKSERKVYKIYWAVDEKYKDILQSNKLHIAYE